MTAAAGVLTPATTRVAIRTAVVTQATNRGSPDVHLIGGAWCLT